MLRVCAAAICPGNTHWRHRAPCAPRRAVADSAAGDHPSEIALSVFFRCRERSWLVLGMVFGGNEAAIMKYQCRLRRCTAAFDFTHKNHVVAFRIAAAVMAFEPGRSAFENRQPGMRQLEIDAFETILDAARKTLRQMCLTGRQHVDDVVRI